MCVRIRNLGMKAIIDKRYKCLYMCVFVGQVVRDEWFTSSACRMDTRTRKMVFNISQSSPPRFV